MVRHRSDLLGGICRAAEQYGLIRVWVCVLLNYRFGVMCMSTKDQQITGQRRDRYASYNIRFHPIWPSPNVKQVLGWIEDNCIDAKLFESFDGAGSNGLILECRNLDDLLQFCLDWLGEDSGRCWAEDQNGKHHGFEIQACNVIWRT